MATPFLKLRRLTSLAILYLNALGALANPQPPVRIGLSETLPFYDAQLMEDWSIYLQEHLGREVFFVSRPSHNDVLNLLVEDKLDFAWICPAHYIRHHSVLRLLTTPVFQDRPMYQTLLLADADSTPDIRNLGDLKNTVVAFAESDTNFGNRLVFRALRKREINPDTFFRRVFYTGQHDKVLYAMSAGLAHSGVVVNQAWRTFQLQEPALAARMHVIWQSDWRPLPPVVGSQLTDADLVRELESVLLGMHEDIKGRRILSGLHFDRFITAEPGLYTPQTLDGSNASNETVCPE